MNIWHDIKPEQIRKDAYTAVVTNTQGSTAGLAFDGDTGLLRLEYLSDTGMGIPFNTAMIPRTCTPTGAPIESILLCSHPIPQMTLVECRPVGLVLVRLTNGKQRVLLLSAVDADEFLGGCMTVEEIPSVNRRSIIRWLRHEHQLLRSPARSVSFAGIQQAEQWLESGRKTYLTRFCGVLPRD